MTLCNRSIKEPVIYEYVYVDDFYQKPLPEKNKVEEEKIERGVIIVDIINYDC